MLEIRKIAQNVRLDQQIDLNDLEQIKNFSINYGLAKRELYNKYIVKYLNHKSEVVFEATRTFLKLLEKGNVKLKKDEISTINDSIIYVLKTCKKDDWRTQLRSRETYIELARLTQSENDYDNLYDNLIGLLKLNVSFEAKNPQYGWNIALIMADLEVRNETAVKILTDSAREGRSDWSKNISAISLIKMGENNGWQYLSDNINKGGNTASIAAFLLGQIGKNKLKELGVENLNIRDETNQLKAIAHWIELRLKEDIDIDKYSREYMKNIIKDLRDSS